VAGSVDIAAMPQVRTLRIAQVAPLYESVPPRFYGGTERVVAHLCDALTELGHDVTLFATAEAETRAELVAVRDQAIRLDDSPLKSDLAAHLTLLHEARRRARQFDVLHFHTDMLHFAMFEPHAHRSITTIHGRLDLKDLPHVYARWPGFPLVSISNAQRQPLPRGNWFGTVAHGLPCSLYPFTERPQGGYFAFLGRLSPEKRPDVAIRLAQSAGVPIRIAAKVDAADQPYFERTIAPLLREPGVEFIGEIGDHLKARFLGEAQALLFPINWPEPFGLVMIEAMACGTPVIAWNRGSVPEIIEPGVSGYIVSSEEEARQAITRVASLDRRAVRRAFEERFTAQSMARGYLELYRRLIEPRQLASGRELALRT
jgi:glycosyltransferase involved in cell wall biosynthesis